MSTVATAPDDAWQEGYAAFEDGVAESKNPYPHGCDEHLSWNDGWLAAQTAFTGSDADAHTGGVL